MGRRPGRKDEEVNPEDYLTVRENDLRVLRERLRDANARLDRERARSTRWRIFALRVVASYPELQEEFDRAEKGA